MKKKSVIIGMVAVMAVVCLNLRHAWKNYGIAENRIVAGVVATPTPTPTDSTTCATKQGYPVVSHDMALDSIIHEKMCPVLKITYYYKIYEDGYERLIATETIDYKANSKTLVPYGAQLAGTTAKDGETKSELFKSVQYICKGLQKGNCCYPTTALLDCDKLIHGTN